MDWKMSHKSSHLQNTTFSMNLKSTQVKRFLSEMSLTVSGVVGAVQKAQVCLGTDATAREGRDEHQGS